MSTPCRCEDCVRDRNNARRAVGSAVAAAPKVRRLPTIPMPPEGYASFARSNDPSLPTPEGRTMTPQRRECLLGQAQAVEARNRKADAPRATQAVAEFAASGDGSKLTAPGQAMTPARRAFLMSQAMTAAAKG
jgi:hypothetical protein